MGEALRRIEGAGGDLRVRDLAAGLGLSDRRLEQLFHWHVGLSPKAACRLARFRTSVELLVDTPHPQPQRSWAEIALASGFSDQSHLVNEFRALTGLGATRLPAPGRFRISPRPRRQQSLPSRKTNREEAQMSSQSDTKQSNQKPLAGRIAVVTGASRGGGRGIAVELGAAGATVYVTGRSTREAPATSYGGLLAQAGLSELPGSIDETAEEVTRAGGRGIPVRCDHTDEAQVR